MQIFEYNIIWGSFLREIPGVPRPLFRTIAPMYLSKLSAGIFMTVISDFYLSGEDFI